MAKRKVRMGYYATEDVAAQVGKKGLNEIAREKIGHVLGASKDGFMYLGHMENSSGDFYYGYGSAAIIESSTAIIFSDRVSQIESARKGLEKLFSTELIKLTRVSLT